MAIFDIQHMLHEELNALDYASSMQVPSWCQTMEKDIFSSLQKTYEALESWKDVSKQKYILIKLINQILNLLLNYWNNISKWNQD